MAADNASIDYSYRHLRLGWWSIAVFATLGLTLEALHGFKVRAYLDVSNETRRLMWTLAHAHGTLLGIVHVVFGLHLKAAPAAGRGNLPLISALLVGAGLLLPAGFFLGGVSFYAGDPGLGVLVVPVAAAMLIVALVLTAASLKSQGSSLTAQGRKP